MIKLRWAYLPQLIVLYSGKRYIALNIEGLTIATIQAHIPLMIQTLKKDMRDVRRQVPKLRVDNH